MDYENERNQACQPYQVFLSCLVTEENGKRTRDYLLARRLYKQLTENGVKVFFRRATSADTLSDDPADEADERTDTFQEDDAQQAVREAEILIMVGSSVAHLASPMIRGDYDAFIEAVYAEHKEKWRIVTYLVDMMREDLPEGLQRYRSFSRFEISELIDWCQEQLARQPKRCIADAEEESEDVTVISSPAPAMPDAAESSDRLPLSDEIFGAQQIDAPANGASSLARRAANMGEISLEEAPAVPPVPAPMPSLADLERTAKNAEPQTPTQMAPGTTPIAQIVKPAKINKVDFSVVAPEKVRPGGDSLVDVYMYTKSQRKIVERAIKAAKEKVTEAARTTGSVSVRQGSHVTVVLSSKEAVIEENSETLIWSGDALDFRFRFSLSEGYQKKLVNFACEVLFDGIHITRLYFSVPVNTAKSVPVRFVRKDSRRAFVSYSNKDKARVVEQLYAIQRVAPKLRFWMDSQSIVAGEQWRPAIFSAIKRADVFLLFWSHHSKASPEVRKEWEYALALEKENAKRGKNGARFISPVPLEPPQECPPPAELSDLHFGSPAFDAGIDHIEDVHFVTDHPQAKNIKFF